jgi:coenzyme F420-reducing hydrogenase gamma subunit
VDFWTLKPSKGINETDVALVEGAICTEEEVEKLKEIRRKTKKLVTFGSGATTGWPSDFRNKFDSKKLSEISKDLEKFRQIDKVSPVKRFVKVDEEIPGCPVNTSLLIAKIEGWVNAQL